MLILFGRHPYCCGVISLCFLILFGCQEKERYLSLAQHEHYVYGTLQTKNARTSKQLIRQIQHRLFVFSNNKSNLVDSTQVLHAPKADVIADPIDLLPTNTEIGGWEHAHPPKIYTGKELYYDVPFGNPQLYFRHGFQRQSHVEFQSSKLGSRPLILAEVFDLGTAENAYSLFSATRLPQDQYQMIGSQMAAEMDDRLLFWKGQYLVDIEMYEYATAIRQAVITIAERIENKITVFNSRHEIGVPLVPILPTENHVLHSTYLSLDQKIPPRYWPLSGLLTNNKSKSVFRTYNDRKSESNEADYHGFIMEFENTNLAQRSLKLIQKELINRYGTATADKINNKDAVIVKYQTR